MKLKDIIIQKIRQEGPISFKDYMEMALYYPGLGYYTSPADKFGPQGDYYTSPVISSLYGQMMGRQLEEMWHILKKGPFTIVEYGAGEGGLAAGIIQYFRENNADLYQKFRYVIIEKSPSLIEKQQRILTEKVTWHNNISELNGFKGCILTNEVLDNFAVHSVVMKEKLMEVYVDYQEGFSEVFLPAPLPLKAYLADQHISLAFGYRTEINLEAVKWIEQIAAGLEQGYVITIDYGYPAADYYSPQRNLGTLACFHRHTVSENYYENIGEQDITAHVNFTALTHYGKKYGLEFAGFSNQNYFLRFLGLANLLREAETSLTKESFIEVNRLLMEMGNKFKVLIQRKNTPSSPLSGMQFSRNVMG